MKKSLLRQFSQTYPKYAYYTDSVAWAVTNNITSGTTSTTFSPDDPCTRAQIVTFLWRVAGSPVSGNSNRFTDVDSGTYYYDAVQWAVAQGITTGTTPATFSPDIPCTRGQAITFLHRANNAPKGNEDNTFVDVASKCLLCRCGTLGGEQWYHQWHWVEQIQPR